MELNHDNMKKIRSLILFLVAAVVVGVNYQKVLVLLGDCISMVSPFLLGGAIAFVLNVPMRAIENHTSLKKLKKCRRPLCLVLSVSLVFGVLALVVFVVGPELVGTVMSLKKSVPAFFETIRSQAENFFAAYPNVVTYIEQINVNWEQVGKDVMGFLTNGAGSMVASTFSAAMSIVSGVTNFCIGFVFAVYVLLQKEVLARQVKKLAMAYLPEKIYKSIFKIAVLTERTFSNFLAGQCMEAVILGTMFFVTLTVMRLPYGLLIGVLIAFTALIPIFGAFVGCIVGAFLIFMVSPVKALIFLVVFQILQQIEGNLIYPHVVGGSVGLPSIWVLVAVTIGGSAMGVLGMLVFIPLCSVLYSLLKEDVNRCLKKKTGSAKRYAGGNPGQTDRGQRTGQNKRGAGQNRQDAGQNRQDAGQNRQGALKDSQQGHKKGKR